MIVVVSDIHLQDTSSNAPNVARQVNVQPAAFAHLWRQIEMLAAAAGTVAPLTVVLNGDILELLRSQQWLVDDVRPYNFVGAPEPATLQRAALIGQAVLVENAAAIDALAGARTARFVFVYGNHDRLLREPTLEGVRADFARRLRAPVRFVDGFTDERHQLMVQHGHELDWTCSEYQHERAFDDFDAASPSRRVLAPLGDWLALEIETRLPHLAWQMLESGDRRWEDLPPPARRGLHARLMELEDLRPQAEVLRWLVESVHGEGTPSSEGAAIARFLGDVMNELVTRAMPFVEPWLEAHGQPVFDRLALGAIGLLGSTSFTASTVPTFMARVQRYLADQERPWRLVPGLAEFAGGGYRYFAGGHTHNPMVVPLRPAKDSPETRWYVNTGTWRPAILRPPLGDGAYGAVKQLAFAVFYDADESARIAGRRDVTFDLWQGATQRF